MAVVGGGLTGSSAALALAKKGARVALLEAETIGNAASGRNGGMCNNGFAQSYAVMAGKYGNDAANALYKAFDAGVDMVERLVQEEGIDCSFARVGKLKLAAKPEHYAMLARNQELLAANVDPETRMIARADLRSEVGTDRYHGGLLFPKSAGMHVGRFVRGLATAAARRGAEIHEHAPVMALRKVADGHEVETPKGKIVARAGPAGERHLPGRAARMDPAPHRAGRRVPDRDGAAVAVAARAPDADAPHGRRHAQPRRLLAADPGQSHAVRRAGPVCRFQPAVRREERPDPEGGDGRRLSRAGRHPGRLLLGRHWST